MSLCSAAYGDVGKENITCISHDGTLRKTSDENVWTYTHSYRPSDPEQERKVVIGGEIKLDRLDYSALEGKLGNNDSNTATVKHWVERVKIFRTDGKPLFQQKDEKGRVEFETNFLEHVVLCRSLVFHKPLNEVFTLKRIPGKTVREKINQDTSGTKISNVKPGSAYQKMGLQDGDVIIEIDGQKIAGTAQAMKVLNSLKGKKKVTLKYIRKGETKVLEWQAQ